MRASGALSPGVRAALIAGATSLFMVLVAWATLIGPSEVFTGPGVPERTFAEPRQTCVPLEVVSTLPDGTVTTERPDNPQRLPYCEELTPTTAGDSTTTERSDAPFWLTLLVWLLLAAVGVMVLALLAAFVSFVRNQVRSRTPRTAPVDVEIDMLSEPDRLKQAISDDAVEQDRQLHEGDARNAIVAAWARFEVQGRAAGVDRHPWETSSEYALRILDRVSADSGAVNRLAGLYREARFSEHPITEEHRAAALEALVQIRRGLGVRA